MKKQLFFILSLVLLSTQSFAQTVYRTIESSKLGETRELKIQLPRNYSSNENKIYPLIVVLDGDYLFEPVAGNVDYSSYWEEMPEAIVVGVNHKGAREKDAAYDDDNFLPVDTGALFFEFLGMELMPFMHENYRIAKFSIIVGHDFTSNFINYYLLKSNPVFKGYVNISPDYVEPMPERIASALASSTDRVWFYQATATNDIEKIQQSVKALDDKLKNIDNKNLNYFSDNFEGASHYSMVGLAIPKAMDAFFSIYRPISKKEYEEVILPLETSPYDYLVEKYSTIEDLFGLEKQVRVNDFLAIASALEKQKKWDDLEKLGKLARKEYEHNMLGNYFLARSYEENGNPKKAMKTYQNAFIMEEVAFLTKDLMLQKADQIKADFGYN